jgi:DNA-binding transcriptional MerR regulator
MIGTQLDLFGGLPKPPKKITIDEEPEPVAKVPETPLEEQQPIKAEETQQALQEGQSASVHVQMPSSPTPADATGIIEVASDNMELHVLSLDLTQVSDEEEVEVTENIEAEILKSEAEIEVSFEDDEEVSENIEAENPTTLEEIDGSFEDDEGVSENIEAENPTTLEEIDASFEDDEEVSENIEAENPTTLEEIDASFEDDEEVSENIEAENPTSEPEIEVSGEDDEEYSENIEAENPTAKEIDALTDEILLPEAEDIENSIAKSDDVATDDTSEAANEENGLNIPEDKVLYSRQYYTMRETSAMFQVNQSLLRFWENEFDILKPKKNRKGDRYFRPEDIKNLELIYHLLRVRKFTINGAKDYLKSRAKALDTFEMVQSLDRLKAFLVELKTNL